MPASYAETIAFDAVVVFIVAVMLPLSVLLLRSRSNTGKMAGSALLALSVLYIGGVRPNCRQLPAGHPHHRGS